MGWQKRVWMADCRTTSLPDSTAAVISFSPLTKKYTFFPHFYFLFEFVQSCTTLVYIIGSLLGGQIVVSYSYNILCVYNLSVLKR